MAAKSFHPTSVAVICESPAVSFIRPKVSLKEDKLLLEQEKSDF